MSSRWLKWTASLTRVIEKTPESKVPKLPEPTPESTSGTSGTLALGGARIYYAQESPWPGYNGGLAFVCKACGCHFDTSAGYGRHLVYDCAVEGVEQ
jgi:hypothetical protein